MEYSVATLVKRKIDRIEPGVIFSYNSFNLENSNQMAIASALTRLTQNKIIVRFSKGKYYKPKQSAFGILRTSEQQVIDALTMQKNERIGYLTGLSIYNALGLTTQISNTLTIATSKRLPNRIIEGYKVKFVQRDVPIKKQYIPLLQLLDAIRDIKNIPDTSVDESLQILIEKIKSLTKQDQQLLAKLAIEYNPSTRALTGAIIEQYIKKIDTTKLADSINKLSEYTIGITNAKLLPNQSNWNIL
jgi:predicted transcriptional regulator of viral defense system